MRTSIAVHYPRSVGFGLVLLPLLAASGIVIILAMLVTPAPVQPASPALVPATSPFFVVTFQYGTSTHMQQTMVVEAGGSIVRNLPLRDKVLVLVPPASDTRQQEILKALTANARILSVEPFSETP